MDSKKAERNLDHLLPCGWERVVDTWLQEDVPSFDYGGFVVGDKPTTAHLFQKASGVLAGIPILDKIFEKCNCQAEWLVKEGEYYEHTKGERKLIARVTGPTNNVLQAERIALNVLCRSSGVATVCHQLRQVCDNAGWQGKVAGTRKTTPGFRIVEKYAMMVGGIDTHRHDLSSMIMLKDNHINAHGSITQAVKEALSVGGFALKVEVECQNEEEAREAIAAGAHIVMLDNFSGDAAKEVGARLKKDHPGVIVEVSGGITIENLAQYLGDGVDIVSTSSTSQSVPHIDFSLKILHLKQE
uniref:Nicotinate-nucleotide pyrophosphorylase [carboxylating] n=1 Tax=Paramoeba aestuarina TaxID=180227 RepID=A0A7S4UAE4_9EUKA